MLKTIRSQRNGKRKKILTIRLKYNERAEKSCTVFNSSARDFQIISNQFAALFHPYHRFIPVRHFITYYYYHHRHRRRRRCRLFKLSEKLSRNERKK